jgi:phosphate transport system permease protein
MLKHKSRLSGDTLFAIGIRTLAFLLIALFVAFMVALIVDSWPSIQHFGLSFLWSTAWSPMTGQFGALTAIWGTIVVSAIAMMIAVPLSFGLAVTMSEVLPPRYAAILARIIELMAGIPSIIYGMWGLFVFVPIMATYVQPWLIHALGNVPVLKFIFGGLPIGIGVFTAGIVLSLMVIPLITSVMRSVLTSVPDVMKEAAYSMGATRWEVVRNILIPYTKAGLLGSVILGFGRALGETMAVTFVIGNSHQFFSALFMPGVTISSTIANEFTEATGHLYPAALMELGLILFLITFMVLALSRYCLKHSGIRGGSQ